MVRDNIVPESNEMTVFVFKILIDGLQFSSKPMLHCTHTCAAVPQGRAATAMVFM